ncbi:hypothetical protein AMATHDRAFT_9409 [Amanita thiersii Skay4041]|uniref:Uncharacterized protein n=1 Tax=Amanita thiersii Skay4041 TaxID=703135 RepID=A0A2A9N8I7_9AGAR|nr:hypothetical protein AMATHDRAFT_9409 [Amanita thiersii Skay4041]
MSWAPPDEEVVLWVILQPLSEKRSIASCESVYRTMQPERPGEDEEGELQ